MPKRATTVRFVCSICERKHVRKELSERCEAKGIAIPEFHQCQVVEYTGPEPKYKGRKVIVISHAHRIYLKPTYIHEVPSLYNVCVGKDLGWYADVSHLWMCKVDDFKSDSCPVCGSIRVYDSTRENYQVFTSLFPGKLPQLGTVPCRECPNCKRKFFTPQQFAEVYRKIKLSMGESPSA